MAKIASPTILARIPVAELDDLMRGYGHEPYHVGGHDPAAVHQQFATVPAKGVRGERHSPGRIDRT